jgi:cysteine-rich repeat protein
MVVYDVFALSNSFVHFQDPKTEESATYSGSISLVEGAWGVRITWNNGIEDELIQYRSEEDSAGSQSLTETLSGRGRAGVISKVDWSGTLSMFDTQCKVAFELFPLGDNSETGPVKPGSDGGKLYFWKAVTWECDIGPGTAPGMREEGNRRLAVLTQNKQTNEIEDEQIYPFDLSCPGNKPRLQSGFCLAEKVSNENCIGGCAENSSCWLYSRDDEVEPWPYLCVCDAGFYRVSTLDKQRRKTCVREQNECLDNTHDCHKYALCIDTRKNFTCACLKVDAKGAQVDFIDVSPGLPGRECADVDECLRGGSCSCNAKCVNTVGSFHCSCNPGFVDVEGNEKLCVGSSDIVIETGRVLGGGDFSLTFSWKLRAPPNSKDVIFVDKGFDRQLWWKFLSAADTCTGNDRHDSTNTVSVGDDLVSPCHIAGNGPSSLDHSWGAVTVRQVSAGPGTYYARLYSHHYQQIVAIASFSFRERKDKIPGNVEDTRPNPPPPGDVVDTTSPEIGPDQGYFARGGAVPCEPQELLLAEPFRPQCLCRGVNTTALSLVGFSFAVLPTDSWCDDERLSTVESRPYCGLVRTPTWKEYQSLDIKDLPVRCGDGKVTVPDETCDDGNSNNGDGCNADCLIEPLSECHYKFNPEFSTTYPDLITMKPVYVVSPPESSCRAYRCGDGERNLDWEQCDDANSNDLDGCTKECTFGAGYTCERNIAISETGNITDRGESCTPFILPWTGAGCPRCSGNGQCVIFANVKYCLCLDGYNDLGMIKSSKMPPELKDAAYLQDHEHVCREINECLTPGSCPDGSICLNNIGSFNCSCPEGKKRKNTGSTFTCVDINECIMSSYKCVPTDQGGLCKNTDGSFQCVCRKGYIGYRDGNVLAEEVQDPEVCADIDECISNSHSCPKTQSCVNTQGSFECICPEDYPIAFPPTHETGASISTNQVQEPGCWSSTFIEDNDDFFMSWGRERIVNSLHGLVRFWYLPQSDDSTFATSGLARWWFLKGETTPFVHNGAYLVPSAGLDVGVSWRSQSQNLDEKLSLQWTCAVNRKEIR